PVMLPHNLSKNGDRSESEAMKAVRAAMAANQTAIIVMRKGANDEAEGTADKDAAGEDTKAEASDSKNSALIGLNAADALAADALAGEEVYRVGTEIALGQMMPYPDQTLTVLAQGRRRVEIVEIISTEPYITARARVLTPSEQPDPQADALMDTALGMFQQIAELTESVSD